MRCSQLRRLFGFRLWSAQRKDLVAKRLAVQGIEVAPPLGEAGGRAWLRLSLPALVERQRRIEKRVQLEDRIRSWWADSGPAVEVIVLASTLGPLVTAFCSELGKRLGGSTADWISRVTAHARKSNREHVADIVVEAGDVIVSLEITDTLTDDAKLALLDLDINDQAVRGRKLRWVDQAGIWAAVRDE